MKSSNLFAQCLENEGVEYIFGVPGEENLDLLESIRDSRIKFITTRHEQAAAFMAATYGRLTGRAGVVLTTLGPGATNLLTGIAYAQLGGMPLVCVTGQKPIKRNKQGKFQKVDIVAITVPITKLSRTIENSNKIPALVRRAFAYAKSERPGAVLLEFPEDIARQDASAAPIMPGSSPIPSPHKNAIREAMELISASRASILVIGADAKRWNIEQELAAFIDATHIPFAATQLGKGMVPETHPRYLGTTSLSSGETVHNALQAADLLIMIGHTTFEKPPVVPDNSRQRILHINTTPAEIGTPFVGVASLIYQPMLEVVGDVAETLRLLGCELGAYKTDESVFQKFFDAKQKHSQPLSPAAHYPLHIDAIVAALQDVAPKNAVIALDNGLYKLGVTSSFCAMWRHHLLLDNTLATMGAGLPSAIAAKLVYPERRVVVLCGDGGFLMNSQELETAIRLELDILVIVLNDNGFGMIREKQKQMGFDDFGVTYRNPDFVKLAESYGAKGHRMKEGENFTGALRKLVREHGVSLLEVPIEYSENYRLTKELTDEINVS